MKLNRVLVLVAMALLVVGMVGCSGGGGASAPSTTPGYGGGSAPAASGGSGTTVIEKGFAFEPATLEVKVGDTVTFKNEDSAPHVVKIDGRELGQQESGASVTWTAETAGSFPYTCTIHPAMTGEITVK